MLNKFGNSNSGGMLNDNRQQQDMFNTGFGDNRPSRFNKNSFSDFTKPGGWPDRDGEL